MKKVKLLALVCLMSITMFGQVTHSVTFNRNFSVKTVILQDGKTYSKIAWNGLDETAKEGYPVLPIKYIRLLIPNNTKAESVSIFNAQAQTINIDAPLQPGQAPIPIADEVEAPVFVKGLDAIYNSDKPFPETTVEIIEENIFRGNRIVTLAVYPFQYNPAKGELLFYNSVTIDLNLSESKTVSRQPIVRNDNSYLKILTGMINNKEDIEKYNVYTVTNETNAATPKTPSIVPVCDYVIITPSALASGFTEFIDWKKKKGVNVVLVTTESIYANYTGDLISGIYDNAGKVRQFLYDCYVNGLQYALLAGDYNYVPIRYCHHSNSSIDTNYIVAPYELKINKDNLQR